MKNLRQMLRRAGWLNSSKRKARPGSDSKRRRLSSQALERRELLAGDVGLAHNGWNPYDVNDDRQITALDALIGLNQLGAAAEAEHTGDGMFLDVNNDGKHTAGDSLQVINAMARGEEVGELVELLLTARDLNDNEIVPDGNGIVNIAANQQFNLEVAYNDLRTFGGDIGAFQLFVDIAASTGGILTPVLNETQRLVFDEAVRTASSGDYVFSLEGSSLTYTSPLSAFGANPQAEVVNALTTFGYAASEYEISMLDFGNDDIGFQIKYTDTDQFGNVDLPDISVADNLDVSAPVTFTEFAPFEADGVTPNSDAVRFNLDTRSRTFNNNSEFYNALNAGAFDTVTGYDEIGGVGGVPTGGGGIPELSNDGQLTEPFDALSVRVFFNQEITGLNVSVNPGEGEEAMLLYGRNDPVPQDLILIDENATVTFNVGAGGNTAPVLAGPVTASFQETDPTATVDLLTGATDADPGDTLSITTPTITGDQSGISVNNNIVTVNPGAYSALDTGQSEVITFSYNVTDGTANVAQTATITINGVGGVNDPPVPGAAVTATFTEDDNSAFVDLLQNASDPDNDPLTTPSITVVSGNDDRGITIDLAGSGLNVNPSAYNFLNTGESVVVNYNFTISDGVNAPVSSTAAITITGITDDGDNDPPVLSVSPLTATFSEDDAPSSINLLQGASDPNGDSLNVANLSLQSGDASGITDNGNSLGISPNAYTGLKANETETVVYNYQVTDGTDPVNQSLTITINGANDAPTVSGPVTRSFTISDPVTIVDLLANATDVDGDALSVTGLTNTGGDASGITTNGTTISVDPSAYNLGPTDSEVVTFSYTIDDSNGGTVGTSATITIAGFNNPPVLSISPLTATFDDDGAVGMVDLLQGASDSEPLNAVRIVRDSGDARGVTQDGNILNIDTSAYGFLAAGAAEVIRYRYEITDGTNDVDQQLTITINGVNDPPVVSSPITQSFADTAATTSIDLLQFASDIDRGDVLSVTNARVLSGDGRGVSAPANSLIVNPRAYASLLASGESETIVVGYNVIDGNGGSVATTATVTINGTDTPVGVTVSGNLYVDELDSRGVRSGVQESSEKGLAGVAVHLRTGGTTLTALTDVNGGYSFTGVVPGTYELEYDLPDSVVFVGSSTMTMTVGDVAPASMSFGVLGFSGLLGNIDILASSYLRSHPNIFDVSNGGVEGGSVLFDEDGNQELLVLAEGFDDILFAELSVNDALDQALLSIVDGNGEVRTALLSEEHFMVRGNAIHFFGSVEDFNFVSEMDNANDFSNFRDAIDAFLAGRQ